MLCDRELATDLAELQKCVSEACFAEQRRYDGLCADYFTFFDLQFARLGQVIELILVNFQLLQGYLVIFSAHFCRYQTLIKVLNVFNFASVFLLSLKDLFLSNYYVKIFILLL